MTILQKTVYQTADGKIFYSKEEAELHQNIEKAYDDAYNEHACYGKFEFLDAKEFAEFVCKYADMIRGETND